MSNVAMSWRVLTEDESNRIRKICEEHKFSYSTFLAIIVKDALQSQESINKYIAMTQQVEDDQQPASIAELKALREQLRVQEAELEQLRQFKAAAQDSLVSR